MKKLSSTTFILSTFAFSWVCWGIAIATGQPSTSFPTVVFYMLGGSGPSLVALYALFRYFDKAGRRDFWSRLIDVRRIRPFWWILCLFATPVLIVLAIGLDVWMGGTLAPMPNLEMLADQPAAIPMFVLMMLVGGALSEELGWRGFVLDFFQEKWTPFVSTLILAAIWCAFHLPLFFIPGTAHYNWGLFSPMFWLFFLNVIPLTAFMTVVYNHNRRSILSAVAIHFSYNLMLALIFPISVRAYGFLAGFLMIMVLALLKLYGWSPQPRLENSAPAQALPGVKS